MYKTLENSSRHGTSHEAKFLCIRDKRWLSLIVKIYAAPKFYMHSRRTCRKKKNIKKSQYDTEYHQKTTYLKNQLNTVQNMLQWSKCRTETGNDAARLRTRSQDLVIPAPRREEGDDEGDATRLPN